MNSVHAYEHQRLSGPHHTCLGFTPPTHQESGYAHMNEQLASEASGTQSTIRETSEERVWETPGYLVVETALEVTAYALGER
ncbi:hypothetical protein GCM10011579_080790 [Streptomyces albiflavescens]|uniref:Coenzyme PQQ synthesis protein A n=1 Tax=Streptomyces albiflavescens TaxID=1623582 RepID=A0A917YEF3_9ACTN|nr:hypothetical protein GCM10011579_080790 [Streptomyces albiflavescens]